MKTPRDLKGVKGMAAKGVVAVQVNGLPLHEANTKEASNQVVSDVQVSPGDIISIAFRMDSGAVDIADLLVDGILRNSKVNTRATKRFSDIFDRACHNPRKPGKMTRVGMRFCEMQVIDFSGDADELSNNAAESSPVGTIEVRFYRVEECSSTSGPSNQATGQHISTLSRGPNFVNYATWLELVGAPFHKSSPPPFEIAFCNPYRGTDPGSGPKRRVVKDYPATYKLWCSFVFRLQPKARVLDAIILPGPQHLGSYNAPQKLGQSTAILPQTSSTICAPSISPRPQASLLKPVIGHNTQPYQDASESIVNKNTIGNFLDAGQSIIPTVLGFNKARTEKVILQTFPVEPAKEAARTLDPSQEVCLPRMLPTIEEGQRLTNNGLPPSKGDIGSVTCQGTEVLTSHARETIDRSREGLGIPVRNARDGNMLSDEFETIQQEDESAEREFARESDEDDSTTLPADKGPLRGSNVGVEADIIKIELFEGDDLPPAQRDLQKPTGSSSSSLDERMFKKPSKPVTLGGIPNAPAYGAWQGRGSTGECSTPPTTSETSERSVSREIESTQATRLSPILKETLRFSFEQRFSTPQQFCTPPPPVQKSRSKEHSIPEPSIGLHSFASVSESMSPNAQGSPILGSSPTCRGNQKHILHCYTPPTSPVPLRTVVSPTVSISDDENSDNQQLSCSAVAPKAVIDSQATTASRSSTEPIAANLDYVVTLNASASLMATGLTKRKVDKISSGDSMSIHEALQSSKDPVTPVLRHTQLRERKGKQQEKLRQDAPYLCKATIAMSEGDSCQRSHELSDRLEEKELATVTRWEAEKEKASTRYSLAIKNRNMAKGEYENALLENEARAQSRELVQRAEELERETAELREKTRALRDEQL